jgi:uncharacterized membrane protein required for colicin V production
MSHYIKNEMGADAAAALALFCASLIVLIPVGHLVSSLIKGDTLTAIDRSLGFVFGLIRGALVVSLLYLGASWIWPVLDQQLTIAVKEGTAWCHCGDNPNPVSLCQLRIIFSIVNLQVTCPRDEYGNYQNRQPAKHFQAAAKFIILDQVLSLP